MTKIYSGGPLRVPEVTLPAVLFDTVKQVPDRVGIRRRTETGFEDLTWKQVGETVRDLASGLISLGIEPGDRVAILADTSADWTLADYAILSAGGVSVTVYPTLTSEQVAYLLKDSESKAIFVDTAEQYDKLEEVAGEIGHVKNVFSFEKIPPGENLGKQLLSVDDLRNAGRTHAVDHPDAVQERLVSRKADDLATLVYTSGTTGVPKGAILTHKNFVSAYTAAQKMLGVPQHPTSIAFLPLAHCYGRLIVFYVTALQGSIAYTNPRSLADDLRTVQPQLMASVPRLYERMFDQILKKVREGPDKKKKIFQKARETAEAYGMARANGGKPGLGLRMKHAVFEKLVYGKLREALGMNQLYVCVTGAAAMRAELISFFQGIGVNILEGYGLTETSAPSNVNRPGRYKPGRVGPPFPGMEQKLDEDGEVLMKGPNVFKGYYNLDDETKACFTEDGWFRTGDIGEFDEDGYLRIVDRKKEIEVLDTGKNVAPVIVEETLKGASEYVSEGMAVGQGKKYVGLLIQPNFDALVKFAKDEGVEFDESKVVVKPDPTGTPMTYSVGEDLLANEKVQALYQEAVDRANKKLADYERVKAFRLVPNAFTIDRDELTPTLKKKRRIIRKNYEARIEEMFPQGD